MARDVKEKLFEIDSKKIELGFLQQQFLVECKRFTAQNIERTVRLAISSYPQKAISLGEKGLRPIKEQINKLINNVSEIVEKHINTPKLWLHEQESLSSRDYPENAYATTGEHGPQALENALKKVLSPIGQILISNELDTDNNWEAVAGEMIYRHTLNWPREMTRCIKHYSERFIELSKMISEYESLSVQSAGNDALDLWDSI